MDFRHAFLLMPGLLILAFLATMPACVDDDDDDDSGDAPIPFLDDDAVNNADDDANDDLNDDTSNIDDDGDDDLDDDIDDDLDDDTADDDDFHFGDVEITSSICNSIAYLPQDECADALQPLYCFLKYPVYHERLYTHSEALVACREDSDPVWKDIRECSVILQEFENSFEWFWFNSYNYNFHEFVYCLADRGWVGERQDLFDPNLWLPEDALLWVWDVYPFSIRHVSIRHALGFWSYHGIYSVDSYFCYSEIGGALTGVSDLALRSHVGLGAGPEVYSDVCQWFTGNAIEIGETEITILYDYHHYWDCSSGDCYNFEGSCEESLKLFPVQ
jgi:hypothetical protein